jgi:hypothetical protein
MEKIYNHRILKGYIDHLDSEFGRTVTDQVLSKLHMDRMNLMDMNGFATDHEARSLTEACMELTGEKNLSYLIGRNIVTSVGKIGGHVVGVTSPAIFLKCLGAVEGRLALKTITKTTRINQNRYKIDVTYRDGYVPPVYGCQNRIGSYEAGPLFFGLPYAKVEHPRCLHRDEGDCQYYIQFPEHGFFIFKRASQVLFSVAIISACLWLMVDRNSIFAIAIIPLVIASTIFYNIFSLLSTKKAQEWSLLANDGADKQNRLLTTMYSQLTSLQNLFTSLEEIGYGQERNLKIANVILGELHYGSCQVWLLVPERNSLICLFSKGYSWDFSNASIPSKFSAENVADNPYDYLAQVLESRKALIMNELLDFLPRVSMKSNEFLVGLKLSSMIVIPLIRGERVLGVLAAERYGMKKIDNQDSLVFRFMSEILTNSLAKKGTSAD